MCELDCLYSHNQHSQINRSFWEWICRSWESNLVRTTSWYLRCHSECDAWERKDCCIPVPSNYLLSRGINEWHNRYHSNDYCWREKMHMWVQVWPQCSISWPEYWMQEFNLLSNISLYHTWFCIIFLVYVLFNNTNF